MCATTDSVDPPETERRAELWIRSFSPVGMDRAHRDVLQRLDALVEGGVLTDYAVRTWSKEVGLSTTAARADRSRVVLDRVAAFRSWAEERDRTLAPFFETREATSAVTGESYAAQVLPVRALAEFDGDELVYVAPSAPRDGGDGHDGGDGRRHTTACAVEDRLDELLAGADPGRAVAGEAGTS